MTTSSATSSAVSELTQSILGNGSSVPVPTAPPNVSRDQQEHFVNMNNADGGMFQHAVMIKLRLSKFGVSRKIKGAKKDEILNTNADKNRIDPYKKILECEELDAITSFDNQVRAEVRKYIIDSPAKDGIYLVPNEKVPSVVAYLKRAEIDRRALVEAFVAAYPARVEESRVALTGSDPTKSVFNPRDYPSAELVRTTFRFRWRIFAQHVPDALQEIQEGLYQDQIEQARQEWEETKEMVKQAQRAALLKLVQHLREMLEDSGDGKKRKFYETNITKIQEFIEGFSFRNIANDDVMNDLVSQSSEILTGVNVKDVRTNDELRRTLFTEFAKVEEALESMVDNNAGRAYLFETED